MDGAGPRELREIVSNMLEGFALHEIILDDDGRPVDYRFLDMNPAFERLTGLRREDAVGRTARGLLPGLEPDWIDRYGRVALGGGPVHFTDFSEALGRWFEVRAFSPRARTFACTFADVTERHEAEEAMRRNEALLESVVAISRRTFVDAPALLEFSLEEAVRLTGSRFGALYLYEEQKKLFSLAASSRGVMRDCAVADGRPAHALDATGLWGDAVRERRAIVVNDCAAPGALKNGLPPGHVQVRPSGDP